jgi:GNAT superfamily N-acetyltransferase
MVRNVALRQLHPGDFEGIVSVVDDWWGRPVRDKVPRLFFDHFWSTIFVAECSGVPAGVIIGFLSPSQPTAAYVHLIGVDPRHCGHGLGTLLYERFFTIAREHNRVEVWAVTSPQNRGSIEFHGHLGFSIWPGDREENGVSVHSDYEPSGASRVVFVKALKSSIPRDHRMSRVREGT